VARAISPSPSQPEITILGKDAPRQVTCNEGWSEAKVLPRWGVGLLGTEARVTNGAQLRVVRFSAL
jgi:hypothetical protein